MPKKKLVSKPQGGSHDYKWTHASLLQVSTDTTEWTEAEAQKRKNGANQLAEEESRWSERTESVEEAQGDREE